MNQLISRLIIPAAALMALAACDNIYEDERYVPVDAVEAQRVILLEDFTGQKCNNCPDAHKIIAQLQQQYPGSIVAVSIHAGGMAFNKSQTRFDRNQVCLGTDEGQVYNDAYGIDAWPSGVIDRRSGVLGRYEWAEYIDEELERPAGVNIDLAAAIDGNDIKIDLTLAPKADIDGRLNVWVLENDIVARQIDETGKYDREYVHNHVFRAPVTPVDGEAVALQNGIHKSASYSIALRYDDYERWDASNLSVVAFVSDATGVCQAAIAEVTAPGEPSDSPNE